RVTAQDSDVSGYICRGYLCNNPRTWCTKCRVLNWRQFMFQGSIRVGILPAFLLCAAAALAQSGAANSYDINVINQVAVNGCSAGEPVSLSGVVHLSYTVSTDSNNVNHFAIYAANEVNGAGQNTGVPYVASDNAEYDSN